MNEQERARIKEFEGTLWDYLDRITDGTYQAKKHQELSKTTIRELLDRDMQERETKPEEERQKRQAPEITGDQA